MRACSDNFTQEAHILKLDIKGYFMAMDRQILYNKVIKTLTRKEDKLKMPLSLLDYLLQKVIFNDCRENCIIKGAKSDWEGLPDSKSLFKAGDGKGFPIGNLTSQLFGNVYLNAFDHFVKGTLGFKYYGRYVDDFILMHQSKEKLLAAIPQISAYFEK
jgi:RNA-directed DNA polymerase